MMVGNHGVQPFQGGVVVMVGAFGGVHEHGPNGRHSWIVMKDMKGGFCVELAKRALYILNNMFVMQDRSSGKFVASSQPEEGLNPRESDGLPNPFPKRAMGGSREVDGKIVGRVGAEISIWRAIPGWDIIEVGVQRFGGSFYDVKDAL